MGNCFLGSQIRSIIEYKVLSLLNIALGFQHDCRKQRYNTLRCNPSRGRNPGRKSVIFVKMPKNAHFKSDFLENISETSRSMKFLRHSAFLIMFGLYYQAMEQ